MHTSLILVALLGPAEPLGTQKQAMKWQDSYSTARQMGGRQDKPLAVFIGNGPTGWKGVAQEGVLSKEASRLLAQEYVCLYVDRTRPDGERLAESFGIASGPGLVVSSRDGKSQAFFHSGSLKAGDLEARLARYSEQVATRTELLVESRVSFAHSPAYSPAPSPVYNAPTYAAPSFGGHGFGGFGGFSGAPSGGGC